MHQEGHSLDVEAEEVQMEADQDGEEVVRLAALDADPDSEQEHPAATPPIEVEMA